MSLSSRGETVPQGNPEKIINIGIIRASSIGDVVLATACISLIRSLNRPVQLFWVGRGPSLELVKNAYPCIKTIEIQKETKTKQIIDQLESVFFLVDLQMNLRSRILSQAFKKKYKRQVYNCPKSQFQRNRLILESRIYGRSRVLPQRALESIKPQYKMMTDTMVDALKKEDFLPDNHNLYQQEFYPKLPLQGVQGISEWQKKMSGYVWLAVSPGASYETKRAPLDQFKACIDRVNEKYMHMSGGKSLALLFVGDKSDRSKTIELTKLLNWNGHYLNCSGELSLWQTAFAISHAQCLLSNDSSLAHIAEAVDTPAVVFFGPTVEGFGFAPWRKSSRSFSSSLGCRPCSKHGKTICRYRDQKCFSSIDPNSVANHILELLTLT